MYNTEKEMLCIILAIMTFHYYDISEQVKYWSLDFIYEL